MADHFFSVATAGQTRDRTRSNITVATSAQSSNPIELRVTDAALSSRDVYLFAEWMADLFRQRDGQVIPTDILL